MNKESLKRANELSAMIIEAEDALSALDMYNWLEVRTNCTTYTVSNFLSDESLDKIYLLLRDSLKEELKRMHEEFENL